MNHQQNHHHIIHNLFQSMEITLYISNLSNTVFEHALSRHTKAKAATQTNHRFLNQIDHKYHRRKVCLFYY